MIALEMRFLAIRLGGDASARQGFTAMIVHCEIARRTATAAANATITQANALVILDTKGLHAKKYVAQRIALALTTSGSATCQLVDVHVHLQATVRLASICSVLVTVLLPLVGAVTARTDSVSVNEADFLQTARVSNAVTTPPQSRS